MSGAVSLQEYWNLRAPNYSIPDAFGRKLLQAYLRRYFPSYRSVIEVGPGPGELLSLHKDVPRVVGFDFSEEMLERARGRVRNHGWTNVELILGDITKTHLEEKFDLLMTRTVLMHIHPDEIEKAVDNVAAMSDHLILLELYDEDRTRVFAAHNWVHDYIPLFEARGYKTVEAYHRHDISQVLFIFERKA
jgi:ubiquinone/menaquinone biosynthesis C-methylase UbiE